MATEAGSRELAPCPSSPNCVSSDAQDETHQIDAFELTVSSDEAWSAVQDEVAGLSRSKIVEDSAGYLRVECVSALFRFVDDLELQLRPSDNLIAVRSASRVGYSDMNVNRNRVEKLRAALQERGVVR
jgi:uncharacterized protein (DUF1499 family)